LCDRFVKKVGQFFCPVLLPKIRGRFSRPLRPKRPKLDTSAKQQQQESATNMASMEIVGGTKLPNLSMKNLSYSIHKYSSSSSTYVPENILEDKPKDQSSRWSSEANTPPQYLMLKLDKPSVVTKITFGKYEKTHVCNLKRFKVYGIAAASKGRDDSVEAANGTNTLLLIDSGLKNDPVAETFKVKHTVNGQYLPCKYIQIMPIQSWGPSFNFSIWYVALEGDDSNDIVRPALTWHDQFREKEAIRLCLKHFRQQNYMQAFEFLQQKAKIQLEDPLLSDLHHTLVRQGDHDKSEQIIVKAIEDGLFDSWMNLQQPVPKWTALILPDDYFTEELSPASPSPIEDEGNRNNNMEDETQSEAESSTTSTPSTSNAIALPTHPGCRGGHQMVMDSAHQVLYLFGGWDGNRDLADFWAFHIPSAKWRLLSLDAEADGGPSPRSCHKMVLDSSCRHIFILGRYLERGLRDRAQNIKSDFYMYDIETNKWTMITDDTSAMGGPMLIFDHQMCIDQETRTIYVFGGQSLFISMSEGGPLSTSEKMYCGLFEYHIPTNTWKKRRDDIGTNPNNSANEIKSRSSHSMLFHSGLRKLFIFGGQRKGSDYLQDFFSYNVDTDEVEIISTGSCTESAIPAVGHTQRATIDQDRHEIHVMTGLNKDKDRSERKAEAKVTNSFWVYNIANDKWTCFYRNENNSSQYWNRMQSEEPRPRYAHQLVYDDHNRRRQTPAVTARTQDWRRKALAANLSKCPHCIVFFGLLSPCEDVARLSVRCSSTDG
jgi:hypothetical protein